MGQKNVAQCGGLMGAVCDLFRLTPGRESGHHSYGVDLFTQCLRVKILKSSKINCIPAVNYVIIILIGNVRVA